MSKEYWNQDYINNFINSMKIPFKFENTQSVKSIAISNREKDPETFIKRVTPQIIETYKQNLPYMTPKEWDESFEYLGGGQSRRSSSAILSRMTWNQFLEQYHSIINKFSEEEH